MTKKQVIEELKTLEIKFNEEASVTELKQILSAAKENKIKPELTPEIVPEPELTPEIVPENKMPSTPAIKKLNTAGIIQIGNQFKVKDRIFNSASEAIKFNSELTK